MSDSAESIPQSVDVKRRVEGASNLFANSTPDAHVEGMHATLMVVRDHLVEVRRNSDRLPPQKFAAFVEDMDADPDAMPAAWGADYIELITGIIETLVREDNMQPAVVIDAFDEYVEETTDELREITTSGKGFFDV